jgi:hypothetical protein
MGNKLILLTLPDSNNINTKTGRAIATACINRDIVHAILMLSIYLLLNFISRVHTFQTCQSGPNYNPKVNFSNAYSYYSNPSRQAW